METFQSNSHQTQFEWPEYLVFGSVLCLSVGIGIFYGFLGKNKAQSKEEYLMGNREMNPVAIALSLLCTYVSSITLLGAPAEVYLYGTQTIVVILCYIPLTLSLYFLYIPHYHQLPYTSIFQYLEDRFHRPIRMVLSGVNLVYSIFFMALVVYGPAVSLNLVTGIHHRVLVAVIFTVCIFYSSFGGFKAVLWTDALQAVIMLSSVIVVLAIGISKAGGMSVIWDRMQATDRINFFKTDPDPRTRHTLWTALIGGYFQWLPMYCNQAQFQRYVSLKGKRNVQIALLVNIIGLFVIMGCCYVCGIVIYGSYYNCDPLTNGDISTIDQILPLFVMDTLKSYKGLSGLFVAGITCAALSTVSSVINASSASTTEDYVKTLRPNMSESQPFKVAKLASFTLGLLAFGFVYIAEQMGNIFTAATSLLGILGGPTVGTFIAGQLFPWVNTIGAWIGMLSSFTLMSFIGIGATVATNRKLLPNQALSLDRSGCDDNFNATIPVFWKDEEYSGLIQVLSLSPLWYPALGIVSTVLLSLLGSLFVTRLGYGLHNISGGDEIKDQEKTTKMTTKSSSPNSSSSSPKRIPERLFLPAVLRLWLKIMPSEVLRLVDIK